MSITTTLPGDKYIFFKGTHNTSDTSNGQFDTNVGIHNPLKDERKKRRFAEFNVVFVLTTSYELCFHFAEYITICVILTETSFTSKIEKVPKNNKTNHRMSDSSHPSQIKEFTASD